MQSPYIFSVKVYMPRPIRSSSIVEWQLDLINHILFLTSFNCISGSKSYSDLVDT